MHSTTTNTFKGAIHSWGCVRGIKRTKLASTFAWFLLHRYLVFTAKQSPAIFRITLAIPTNCVNTNNPPKKTQRDTVCLFSIRLLWQHERINELLCAHTHSHYNQEYGEVDGGGDNPGNGDSKHKFTLLCILQGACTNFLIKIYCRGQAKSTSQHQPATSQAH